MQAELLEQLSSIKRNLFEPCSDAELKNFLAIENQINLKIPLVIKKLIAMSEEINDIDGFFSGYEVFSLDELESVYSSLEVPLSFFGQHKLDSEFNLLEDKLDVYLEDPDKVKTPDKFAIDNLARLLPFASHQGDHLVVDLLSDSGSQVFEVMLGHTVTLYSPSIIQHIDYLILGFENGDVYIEDDYIDFPTFWSNRNVGA